MDLERLPVPARDEVWKVEGEGVAVRESRTNGLWNQTTHLSASHLEGSGFWRSLHPEDRGRLLRALQEGRVELYLRLKDGQGQWRWARVRMHMKPLDPGGVYQVLSLYDFDVSPEGGERVLDLSPSRDVLTGVLNRGAFMEVLGERIRERPDFLSVIALDIHRFHEINASYGVEVGDRVLQGVAQRLREVLGEGVPIGRLGPDEFGLILGTARDLPEVLQVVDRLDRVFEDALVCSEEERIFVSVHMGVAVFPADAEDPHNLVRRAELALSSIKPMRERGVAFYSKKMERELLEDASLRSFLVEAIHREELELHYQPIFSLKDRQLVGMEALLRWHHPYVGQVSPARFIPLVEKLGLMGRLTEFVLRRSFQDLLSLGREDLWVSVNFSPSQFHSRQVVERLERILRETGMDPSRLVVEVTESTAMRDPIQTRGILTTLKQMGVRVALDDFGTGYSSMSHLIDFDLDKIKLDRTFVMNLPANARALHVAQTIVQLTHSLGAQAVAEGIETSEQLELLRSWSCDEGQGFLLARPMPLDRVRQFVNGHV